MGTPSAAWRLLLANRPAPALTFHPDETQWRAKCTPAGDPPLGEGSPDSTTYDPSSPNITAPTATEQAVIYYTDDGSPLTSLTSAKKMPGSSGEISAREAAPVAGNCQAK